MVAVLGRRLPLEYRIEEIDRPRRVVLRAQNAAVRSTDVIEVTAAPGGRLDGDLRGEARGDRGGRAAGPARRSSPASHRGPGRGGPAGRVGGLSRVPRSSTRALLARVVDVTAEMTVVPSFSRAGIALRRRLEVWEEPPSMQGQVAVLTGATSGIGLAAATAMARLGATVHLVGRDGAKRDKPARRWRRRDEERSGSTLSTWLIPTP